MSPWLGVGNGRRPKVKWIERRSPSLREIGKRISTSLFFSLSLFWLVYFLSYSLELILASKAYDLGSHEIPGRTVLYTIHKLNYLALLLPKPSSDGPAAAWLLTFVFTFTTDELPGNLLHLCKEEKKNTLSESSSSSSSSKCLKNKR